MTSILTAPEPTLGACAHCGAATDVACDTTCASAATALLNELLDAEQPCHRSPMAAAATLCGCWS
ncbi:MAG: hypothetical protein L0H93_07975 [Nocardioides sp.]|nr:hypothetical protein [Nocardioides sp.]